MPLFTKMRNLFWYLHLNEDSRSNLRGDLSGGEWQVHQPFDAAARSWNNVINFRWWSLLRSLVYNVAVLIQGCSSAVTMLSGPIAIENSCPAYRLSRSGDFELIWNHRRVSDENRAEWICERISDWISALGPLPSTVSLSLSTRWRSLSNFSSLF